MLMRAFDAAAASTVSCRVVQCLCCSLRCGVLFLSIVLFINACLAFAGEALLVYDFAAAISLNIEGTYLPPGTKLGDSRIHGALIFAGVYSLMSALSGLIAVFFRSLIAANIFLVAQIINTSIALIIMIIAWITSTVTTSIVLANVPSIILMIYLCVVANSFRYLLREVALSSSSSANGMIRIPALPYDMDDEDTLKNKKDPNFSNTFDDDEVEEDIELAGIKDNNDEAVGLKKAHQRVSLHTSSKNIHTGISTTTLRQNTAIGIQDVDDDDDDDADLGVARSRRL